jgi:hypothetical protein
MNRYVCFLLTVIVVTGAWAQEEAPEATTMLGDYRDGSQSRPVHRVHLFDAQGFRIFPGVNDNQPFSMGVTCGKCHDVEAVAKGWHFSTDGPSGRPAQPWVFWDAGLATQIPLALRAWPGVFEPNAIGLTDWWFIQAFGRHLTGGQIHKPVEDDMLSPGDPWEFSGDLEINCLACHNAAATHDQAQAAEQIGVHNYAWSHVATTDFAHVAGAASRQARTWEQGAMGQDAPQVEYDTSRFFSDNQVLMDIRRHVPNERCLFCHSNQDIPGHGIHQDQDVHLAAGMSCVDCHRNGLDHKIVRGYEQEAQDFNDPPRAALSCQGCHLGIEDAQQPTAGRLIAPVPEHKGIPVIHFEKLSCTACHSGAWPGARTLEVKTSRAHALGTRRVNRTDDTLPHIQKPVFAVGTDGKIAPHKLVWPAYWGWLQNESVQPATLSVVRSAAQGILPTGYELESVDWPALDNDLIGQVLVRMNAQAPTGVVAVYVSGGKVYQWDGGTVKAQDHDAAAAVTWPMAHDVRPASQSLGVRSCQDCHDVKAGMLFGGVAVDGPLADPNITVAMAEFHGLDAGLNRLFAQSFVFRPWMKLACTFACLLILSVLATYGLRAVVGVARGTAESFFRD